MGKGLSLSFFVLPTCFLPFFNFLFRPARVFLFSCSSLSVSFQAEVVLNCIDSIAQKREGGKFSDTEKTMIHDPKLGRR